MNPLSPNTRFPQAEDLRTLFDMQQATRWSLVSTTAEERKAKLKRLAGSIRSRREAIGQAIRADFRKHADETELTEISPTLEEIDYAIRHLDSWMRPRRVPTPLTIAGGTSRIRYEPKGRVLILSPWNYPFFLAVTPLMSAVAAGNCVILRPSDKVPQTARLLHELIAEVFPPTEVAIVLGGHAVADALLELPFDHILFTGSTAVGRKVMAAAATHLASVTLELGGKSPAVVDETADLAAAAERIAWGKFINAGQTCVAPDYVLVQKGVAERLAGLIGKTIERFYGPGEAERLGSDSLASLVDGRSLARLEATLGETIAAGAVLVTGGQSDRERRRLAPTLLADVPKDSPIMAEEIFGPVLPLLSYDTLDEAMEIIRARPKPLAMYLFSRSDRNIERLLTLTTSGGATVNNTILHLANPNLPFGGVGESGMGAYHGRFGFETFSHARAVYRQRFPTAVRMLYPPYGPKTRRFLGFLRRLTG